MKDVSAFLQAARENSVTVEFTKIDTGELRVMPCTLSNEIAPDMPIKVESQTTDSDHIVVWSLDKNAWRSFRVNTVNKWYVNGPKEEASS
jgi:hypothetical protein